MSLAYVRSANTIVDLDALNAASLVDNANGTYDTTEIHVNATTKKFYFKGAGNLANAGSGVTGQALYSFFKYIWKNTASITQYDFPMLSITNEQFEFIDNWVPDDTVSVAQSTFVTGTDIAVTANNTITSVTSDLRLFEVGNTITVAGFTGTPGNNTTYTVATVSKNLLTTTQTTLVADAAGEPVTISAAFPSTTRKMIRTAGWSETKTDASIGRTYAGIITLGTLVDVVDQPYFTQDSSFIASTTATSYTGPVNEAVQIFGNTTVDATSPINTTLNTYYKVFVRERGKTYEDADLLDIGVTGSMTYIVYRFPVSNAVDLNIITTADTDIDSNGAVPADVGIYADINVSYLANPNLGSSGPVNIIGPYVNGTTYALGDVVYDSANAFVNAAARWYYVDATTGPANNASMASDTGNTWTLWTASAVANGERELQGVNYAFHTIIDAKDTVANAGTPFTTATGASIQEVYEFCQWGLRLAGTIDEVGGTRNGEIADLLVTYVGATLETQPGVFIDSLKETNANNVKFYDYSGTTATYPLSVTVRINFNTNLTDDADAVFYAFYKDPDGIVNGNEFGTTGALQVVKSDAANVGADITPVANNIQDIGAAFYEFSYAYDTDTTGGRTGGTPVDFVVVAIGLDKGQYVQAEGTVTSAGGTISLVAPLERNYTNPV